MMRTVRRLLVLGLIGGLGLAAWKRFVQGPHTSTPGAPVTYSGAPAAPAPAPAPVAPPATPAAPRTPAAAGFAAVSDGPTRWVPPVDGQCPDGYPIKANANSGIFHVPGGRFYARTVPERCYADADAAVADGYRQAKA